MIDDSTYRTTYVSPLNGCGLSFRSGYDMAVYHEGAHKCACGCEEYHLSRRHLPKKCDREDIDEWDMCVCAGCGDRFVRNVMVVYKSDDDGHSEIWDFSVKFYTPEEYVRKNTTTMDIVHGCNDCAHSRIHCWHDMDGVFHMVESCNVTKLRLDEAMERLNGRLCPRWKRAGKQEE